MGKRMEVMPVRKSAMKENILVVSEGGCSVFSSWWVWWAGVEEWMGSWSFHR